MKRLQITIISFTLLLYTSSGCESSQCTEEPKADCLCTFEYNPVCGCNEKTYGNACEAECAGITTYEKGACE